ncbi:signal peptidase II [Lishizhenia tianjinensis]|uniref:Lipoprotein signal peptidase n=1 Tax=Lishizhenia tianjinensis TaxID=477690 RepID=A0A1I7B4Q2_9FLAO|nr:signal peptidase II [Lishizhenia tianjinensis]SFT82156.1 signal peptidase II [Lishizhenia tianjinensis]
MEKNKKFLLVGLFVLLVLIADQVIKIWVKNNYGPYSPSEPILGDWFVLNYTENPGMAFGTTLGGGLVGKLALSIFRILAIGGIIYYIIKQIKEGVKTEYLVALSFVLAGATGNLIDSALYDFIFTFDPCIPFNQLEGSGNFMSCTSFGVEHQVEARNTGFLLGNVVDMFQFDAEWPEGTPWLGGRQIFPAIWNLADGAITVGILMVVIRQKRYFNK